MRKIMLHCLTYLVFLNTAHAFGTETSGGGGAAVCRDAQNKIISAQLLDLYEGSVRFGLDLQRAKVAPKDQILDVLSRIQSPLLKKLITQSIVDIVDNTVFLPNGVGMASLTDLGSDYAVFAPEGCNIEPVGFYESDGTLKVATSIYNALPKTDRAAFFLHEAIYKLARDLAFKRNSSESRKSVAALFSSDMVAGNRFLDELFYSPIEFSMTYFNYALLGIMEVKEKNESVVLSVNIQREGVELITVQCAGNFNNYENKSDIVLGKETEFQLNTKQCTSINLTASFGYNKEPLAGEDFGSYQVLRAKNGEILASGRLVGASKGPQKTLPSIYFIPIVKSDLEIKDLP